MLISQVAQPIKANPRGNPAEQFSFGCSIIPEPNLPHQVRVGQINFHQHTFYV